MQLQNFTCRAWILWASSCWIVLAMLPFISCSTEYRPSNSSSSSLMALEEFNWEENWKWCLHWKQCKEVESHIIPHTFCHDHWVPYDCFSAYQKGKKILGMMEQSPKHILHQDIECCNLWKFLDTQPCIKPAHLATLFHVKSLDFLHTIVYGLLDFGRRKLPISKYKYFIW